MVRSISEDSAIDIITYECGEWSGLAKEITKQIKALPSAEGESVEDYDNISRLAAIANVAAIAKVLARSDKQKALCGRIMFMLENMPTAVKGGK